jgi:hypothetical protein
MSFTISRQVFTSVIVLSSILLGGCDKDTIKKNLSSPSRVSASSDNGQYDDAYGMPPSAAEINSRNPKVKRTVTRTKGTLKGDAPLRYKVRKGDTLWGIANKFLKDPWFWPEIWDKNQRINNPHLIYPGDVLYIYRGPKAVRGPDTVTISDRMSPTIRIERTDGTGEPISTLAPFLSWPRVLDEATIKNAPYIVDGQSEHLLMDVDSNIYIKNLNGQALERYAVFSKGKPMSDPETGEHLGYEVSYGAQAQIEKAGPISTARLMDMKRGVRVGDRLFNISNHDNILNTRIEIPRHKVRGTVMSLYDATHISGTSMIITINKGKRDGIKPGYVVGVYQPGRSIADPHPQENKGYVAAGDKLMLPPEQIAHAVVYSVSDRLSYALITKSQHAVKNGYKIGNP